MADDAVKNDIIAKEENQREKNLCVALGSLGAAVKPHCAQFSLNMMMVVMIGAIMALCKLTQAFMTHEDENLNGVLDYPDEKGEFIVNGAERGTQFLVAFGMSKAFANLFVGLSSDMFGRKPVMIFGWALGILVPIMVMAAGNWETVVASNVFLGFMQGFCWSLTIYMMIDYAGPKNRGVAVGINETIGYSTIAIFNVVGAAMIKEGPMGESNYRKDPYYLILAFCFIGLIASFVLLKDTKDIVKVEAEALRAGTRLSVTGRLSERMSRSGELTDRCTVTWPSGRKSQPRVIQMAFVTTSFLDRNLVVCCQAGLMINFMTAFAWGILTKWIKSYGNSPNWEKFEKEDVGEILLAYGLAKGLLQFISGFFSDRFGRKILVSGGLYVCSLAMLIFYIIGESVEGQSSAKGAFTFAAFLLGFGTAMMYPNVIAAAAEQADPSWRASAVGTYRFWRDSGYWIGGIILGRIADVSNIPAAAITCAILAAISGTIFAVFYTEKVEGDYDVEKKVEKPASADGEKTATTAENTSVQV